MTSPQRRWEGVQKIAIWGDFQGLTGVTRGGLGSKNWKIGVTSFMDGPLKVFFFKKDLNLRIFF